MKTSVLSLLFFVLYYSSISVMAENQTGITGHIRDAATGEDLIGATIYVSETGTGTTTNVYGYYSLALEPGKYTIRASFMGYEPKNLELNIETNHVVNIELNSAFKQLGEITITAESPDEHVTKVQMSSNNLSMETVKSLPAFMGETDVMKSLMLLPGVSSGGEGSSGIFVRGGNVDQNLVQLDEATVYNVSHLMGFFSVFNADAIKDVQIYKGGMPAQYGGRISSVVDLRMKDGNSRKFAATGGIGSISSRLTVEGPLQKNVSSFILSGRRTYADLFLNFASDSLIRNNQLYFYDLNTKANYRFSDKDRVFFSGYFGRDLLRVNEEFRMGWGNETATLRWNHIFNSRIFSNFTMVYSNFDYLLGFNYGVNSFDWISDIRDYTGKADFTLYLNSQNTIKFGAQSQYHQFNPGEVKGKGSTSGINDFTLPTQNALEHAIYASNEQKLGDALTLEYGVRYSLFQSIGESTSYTFNENYDVTDTLHFGKGEIYHTDHGLEPRLALVYSLKGNQSIKASYNRTRQYLQQTNVSTSGTPLDVWFPASPNVKAQKADQWAAGYFRNFFNNTLESSVEVYYKEMKNQLDFRDGANVLLNPLMEADLRVGDAWAYGLEFMFNKTKGDFTGWFSYTWSKAWQQIDGINNGKKYPAAFDRPHDISLVLSYAISPRLNISANWVYQTGKPVTLPIGRYEYGGVVIPVYADRNGSRMPDYHRLDLSATLQTRKKPDRNWQGSWNFSIYNAYYRKNTFSYSFRQNEANPHQTDVYKLYLFGIVPSVTYNFSF
jgi:hypothetical protein